MSALSDALPLDKMRFSGSTQESASFVPRDRFFSVRTEEMPEVITLNYILIAADFPAQLRIFTLQFCRTELAVDRLIIRNFLFQTVILSLELCNQFACRIQRLLQFGFLFLCCNGSLPMCALRSTRMVPERLKRT